MAIPGWFVTVSTVVSPLVSAAGAIVSWRIYARQKADVAARTLEVQTSLVASLLGDPITPDVTGPQQMIQAMGFQPTKIAEQERTNSALENYSKFYTDRRQSLMNAYALAQQVGDGDGQSSALERISSFNQANPEVKISMNTLRDSLRQRAKLSEEAQNGVVLNKKLAGRVKQEVGVQPGA